MQKILSELDNKKGWNSASKKVLAKKILSSIWNLNPQEKKVYLQMQQQATEIAEQFYAQNKTTNISEFTDLYLTNFFKNN